MRTLMTTALALTLTTAAVALPMTGTLSTTGTAMAATLGPGQVTSATQAASPAQVADIVVSADGFTAPAAVREGATTFRVSASDPDGAYIGLVRLRPGATLARYLDDLQRAYGQKDPAAGKAVERDVVMYGGAAVLPGTPVSTTTVLTPGSYYLVDFKDVGRPGLADKVRPLRVLPSARPSVRPRAAAQILQVATPDGARFRVPAKVRGGAPIRVTNLSSQFNEAILMPVKPGTTRADIGAFFAAMDRGERAPYPFTGGPLGTVPMSPGRSAVLSIDLPAGNYALVTWLPDYRTGHMHAAQGMYELITVS
ncbi:hypothetical protein [Actinomadura rudentiformis]|uniref:Copper chaperone PCu(A)C n=1 Tax=Actinomadura rudentiformis TaxID=359158 RepID=A0A6H9YSA6_9ACTN|nr:hypothetical protein [Actinomadura rudentiformis]KAB2346122.1 hypothetical protein F8566_25845 [Actinomadura rudentiformis]